MKKMKYYISIYIKNLNYVANESLSNPKIMKHLAAKNPHKNTIISIFIVISYFFFVCFLTILLCCLLFLLTGNIGIFLIGLTLAILALLAFLLTYSVVEKFNKNWQLLIAKIAENHFS
ncbi:hypothetical protein [Nostoc sp. LEGE 12450]|uniref:hypothetical protein n=1 Tax=Nostoc sp. LEGE 12450 TaxID=1828643 RepID=UPI001881C6B8|nr:hypothetical protein [Nostoc sp. LEGE 12450]MBE8989158.1 hypothetical protein [Nostoc sp. LEGE 12450]